MRMDFLSKEAVGVPSTLLFLVGFCDDFFNRPLQAILRRFKSQAQSIWVQTESLAPMAPLVGMWKLEKTIKTCENQRLQSWKLVVRSTRLTGRGVTELSGSHLNSGRALPSRRTELPRFTASMVRGDLILRASTVLDASS